VSKSAREMAQKAQRTLKPAAEQARETVLPAVTEAAQQTREKLAPRLETAKARVTPVLEEVGPAVGAAVSAAMAASEPYREEARRRGDAAVAALRGEVDPPKPKHRIRKLLMVLGLGAAVACAYKWFKSREAADEWEQAYQPTSARAMPDADVSAGEEMPEESLFKEPTASADGTGEQAADQAAPAEGATEAAAEGDEVSEEAAATEVTPVEEAPAEAAPAPRSRRRKTT
jgi:hypothetical protein